MSTFTKCLPVYVCLYSLKVNHLSFPDLCYLVLGGREAVTAQDEEHMCRTSESLEYASIPICNRRMTYHKLGFALVLL